LAELKTTAIVILSHPDYNRRFQNLTGSADFHCTLL